MNWLELRRQLFHMFNGTLILLAYAHWGKAVGVVLLALSVAGLLASLYHTRVKPIPGASLFLGALEREENLSFPGRGAILYGASASLAILLFKPDAASAAVAALAYGDAASTIVGKMLGRISIPWNRSMSLEGSLAFVMATFMGGSFFVPYLMALAAGLIGALVETIPKVDDNITIPLIVGYLLNMIG